MTAVASNPYQQVLEANVEVHTRMAETYNRDEPHFRPENVAKVDARMAELAQRSGSGRLLDLGCGTGFVIDIARNHFENIVGVDATQAMLDRVNKSGPAKIETICGDTGTFAVEADTFNVVTAYSFLHHLYDIQPTLDNAARALRHGGCFYADLEPNYYFWDELRRLDPDGEHDPVVKREIVQVRFKGEEIEQQYDIPSETFNDAEFGKNRRGGFKEEDLRAALRKAGFSHVEIFHHWFLGQGQVINDERFGREENLRHGDVMAEALLRGMPLTRHLFKYLGFVAVK